MTAPSAMHQANQDYSYTLCRFPRAPPFIHVSQDNVCAFARRMLAAEGLNKVALRVHDVEVDAVVDEVVLAGLDVRRRAEVDTVCLADSLDLIVGAREADELGVELGEIAFEHFRLVARRVTGDEDGREGAGALLLHEIIHARHLVQLIGADVRAVREAKVDLRQAS